MRDMRLQYPPTNPARKPDVLPRHEFMTENRAVAECGHSKLFLFDQGFSVCCGCGKSEWFGNGWFWSEQAMSESLFLYLSVERALSHT